MLPAATARLIFMTNLSVTYLALMFTTIHCKIKRILIVVICYSLGGKYSSIALQQAASAKVKYHIDFIHTCSQTLSFCIIYPEICQDIFIEFNDETFATVSLLQHGQQTTEHRCCVVTDNLNLHNNTTVTINKHSNPASGQRRFR